MLAIAVYLGRLTLRIVRNRYAMPQRIIEAALIREFYIGEARNGKRMGWIRIGYWDYKVQINISENNIDVSQNPYAPLNKAEHTRVIVEINAWLQEGN